MDAQVEIRRARLAERDLVLDMWLRLIEHHRHLDPDYPLPPGLRLGLRSEIDRGLTRSDCALWLAHAGAEGIGFCFAQADAEPADRGDPSSVGWIHELWVEPGWRRRGVAARLVGPALAFLAERGARISVRVETANRDAIAFWQARGFRSRALVLELPAQAVESGDDGGRAR